MLTPIMRIEGLMALAASAMPANSPPPDSGTTMVSMSGRALRISSPIVPWPAMTCGMIEGMKIRHALGGDEPVDLELRVVLALADPAHLGTERLDGIDLHVGHELRQADDGAHAVVACAA